MKKHLPIILIAPLLLYLLSRPIIIFIQTFVVIFAFSGIEGVLYTIFPLLLIVMACFGFYLMWRSDETK